MHLHEATTEVQARSQRIGASRALLLLAAVALSGVFVLFALDNVIHFRASVRIALDGALLVVVAAVAAKFLFWPLARPLTQEGAAILIERRFPELDNRLINVRRLSRDRRTPKEVLHLLHADATEAVSKVDLRSVVPWKTARRVAAAAAVAVLLMAGYAAALPHYFKNALARYASPGTFTPPITRTSLRVLPGNVTVVEGESVSIRAEVGGEIPSGARIIVGSMGYDMRFLGEQFVFEFKNLESPFDYSVQAGDAESDIYHVTVLRRAQIQKLRLELRYPDYLEFPPRVEDPAGGHISVVEGTRVVASVKMTKPLRDLRMVATGVGPCDGKGTMTVQKSGSYRFEWTDEDGLEGKSPTFAVAALRDNPPLVKLVEPSRNLTVRLDTALTAAVQASDDFGLASVALYAGKNLISQSPVTGREIRASRLLRISELKVKAGETIGLTAVARDRKGSETTSDVVYLRVVDEAEAKTEILKELKGIVARLREVIVWQEKVREQGTAPKPDRTALYKAQYGILKTLAEIHTQWVNPELRHLTARGRLEKLLQGPAVKAVEQVRSDPTAALPTQAEIVAELEAVVAELEGLMASIQKGDLAKALADATEKNPKQELRDLLAGLKDFMDQQKKVIQDSLDMKLKSPEDFSEEDRKRLETLRQTEERWGKFFQEKSTDLSKLPPQDFSNGSMSKELNEAFSEVKLAADALNKKAVEMAVPHEESGLELAKSITENIERWLADAPDNLKWNMEEPTKDADVPMADLPAELEDLIGDLLDKEDQLAEDSQDVTSSWMDSLNQGAGWAAADGPISNMSAKGVTGNLQPNSNEVGGRSGEGRSGKSSGQIVEDTATGKGGKQTPTRSTPDPYEAGRVRDSSKDPTGGSTGGGKVGSANKEGLRGVPPQEIQQKMDRLADQQADIRNTTEKVKVALEKRGYVSEDLKKSIELMNALEEKLRRRRGAHYDAEAKAIAERLDALKRTISDQLDVTRDPTQTISKEKRDQLLDSRDEDIPAEFQDWVREYYRSLSEK